MKAALLVVRFEFQIPNYILSKDDVLARVKRYSPDDKNSEDCKDGEVNYPTNGRHLRHTRSRESIDSENTDARESHELIITMRRIVTTL